MTAEGSDVEPSASRPARRRAMIVEDEWLIASVIEQALTEAGFQVLHKCATLAQGLEALAREAPDFAILDSNLRGDSAEPLARQLSERGIPFLVVSGYGRAQLEGILAYAPFVGKPFMVPALIETVRRIVA